MAKRPNDANGNPVPPIPTENPIPDGHLRLDIPNAIMVELAKTEETHTLNLTALPAERLVPVIMGLARHGLRQKLQDAYSQCGDDIPACKAASGKVFDAIQKGEMTAGKGGAKVPLHVKALRVVVVEILQEKGWAKTQTAAEKMLKDAKYDAISVLQKFVKGEPAAIMAKIQKRVDLMTEALRPKVIETVAVDFDDLDAPKE